MVELSPDKIKKTAVYVGDMGLSARSRLWAEALAEIGVDVHIVPSNNIDVNAQINYKPSLWVRVLKKFRITLDDRQVNERLLNKVEEIKPHWVWINKSQVIHAKTLKKIKAMNLSCQIVFYSEDDMYAKHNRSRRFDACLKYYDVVFTTKSYNCLPEELPSLGARKVVFVDKAYQKNRHKPYPKEEGAQWGAPVGFIGTFEQERARSMLYLAENGVQVRIWGNNWPKKWFTINPNLIVEGQAVNGENYPKAICATQINLAFLRKANRDLQTDRSMEIPACEAFMLTERTSEHTRLFKEGEESEFFGSDEELLEKVKFYLDKPELRSKIAAAGRNRCVRDGYDMHSRMSHMISVIEE